MLELADRIVPLLERGVRIAVATSIDVIGSAPHAAGTSMAVGADGSVVGSVSGGCVEAAALADCRAVLGGAPAVVRRHGFGDAAAVQAGLACGGELDVLTCLLDPATDGTQQVLDQLRRRLRGEPAGIGLVTGGPAGAVGAAVVPGGDGSIAGEVRSGVLAAVEGAVRTGRSAAVLVECAPAPLRLFVDVVAPAPRLLLIGATETASALSAAAAAVGFAVTVCDPRADFALPGRFPAARSVVTGLPHEVLAGFAALPADAVCLLSHDEDLDALALSVALEGDAGYVGALGSRSTALRREQRLHALGVPEAVVARLHAPIGLDIGARTPAETAVSIVAELLAVRAGASAAPLRGGAGPIHRPVPLPA